MATGIREIARNAAEASVIARQGVSVALETNQTVAKLGTSSAEVGEVVDVISSIAAHTNLLALNAAIEAARAGESGKGFAVVANEVKELSRETARATAEISRKIAAIQQDTAGAVDAIHRISEIINQIAHIQTVIASAVEEHTATSNEMSRNVREAAEGSAEISQNIAGVAEAATSTSLGARECLDAAAELTRMAKALQAQVASFRI
jgi:methyl-accepting chemotaxis protein